MYGWRWQYTVPITWKCWCVSYADDAVLLAEAEEAMQNMLNDFMIALREWVKKYECNTQSEIFNAVPNDDTAEYELVV